MKINNPILSTVDKAAQAGVRAGVQRIRKRSDELMPKLTGETRESGFTRVDDLTGQVGYSSLVAMLQHENLDYRHDDGQAKFLEAAADELMPGVVSDVSDRIRKAFGG